MNNLSKYLRDTLSELKQVSWPTQSQAMLYTALVIVVSAVVSLFLGAFDFVFSGGIKFIVDQISL